MQIIDLVKTAAKALDDKKAADIKVLNISELTSLADYFVICSCSSSTQVKACCDEVEEKVTEAGGTLKHTEGYNGGLWILLDFGDFIVHVMQAETREFYDIERLWQDADTVEFKL